MPPGAAFSVGTFVILDGNPGELTFQNVDGTWDLILDDGEDIDGISASRLIWSDKNPVPEPEFVMPTMEELLERSQPMSPMSVTRTYKRRARPSGSASTLRRCNSAASTSRSILRPATPSFTAACGLDAYAPSSYGGVVPFTASQAYLRARTPTVSSKPAWVGNTGSVASQRLKRDTRICNQTLAQPWGARAPRHEASPAGPPPASPSLRSTRWSRTLGLPPTDVTERLIFLGQRDLFPGR